MSPNFAHTIGRITGYLRFVPKESGTPDFPKKNPNGRIPVPESGQGVYLPESNAILWYLAEGTELMPKDQLERVRALQWMFFEQYSHEPHIATSRFWITILQAEAAILSPISLFMLTLTWPTKGDLI